MKREKIEALIPLLGSKVTGFRNGWVEAKCPFAKWRHDGGKDNNPSFAIHANAKKNSTYKCFSCGKGGDLLGLQIDLAMELRADPQPGFNLGEAATLIVNEFEELEFDPNIPDYEDEVKPVAVPYPEWWLTSFKPAWEFFEARMYLRTRDVSKVTSTQLELKYDPIRKRVCFPFRDHQGRLMGMQGRDITNKDPLRYYFYAHKNVRNMQYWLGEDHVDFDKPVVLVEGPFDYASVFRLYTNVMASFSAGISDEKLAKVAGASELITFYDQGKGGDSARARVHKVLSGIPIIDVYPENEGGDPGSMSAAEVSYHLGEHISLSEDQS